MRGFLAVVCFAVAACSAMPLSAAERPMRTPLYQAWIASRARFELSGGRVLNNGIWSFPNGTQTVGDPDTREKISSTANGLTGSVVYSCQRTKTDANNGKEVVLELDVEFNSEGRFLLRYFDKDEPESFFELSQTPGQPIRLSLPPSEKPRVIEAATIWHLLIIHADECRKGFLPRLEAMRPDWNVAVTARAAEEELVKLATAAEKPNRQQWASWVDQLADPLYTRRKRAERKLREAGPAVVGYLNQLNPERLDTEQQFRVHRIIGDLSARQGDDTPEAIASLLIGDAQVWLAMLSRDDEPTRQMAVQQLELLLNAPVKIDPKADPASQAKARDELRARIEKPAEGPRP